MIETILHNKWAQAGIIILLAVLLALSGYWAWTMARTAAQAKRVASDAMAIREGLDLFFRDQNRYPSTGEFEDANIMRAYISNFPPQSFSGSICSKSFEYFNAAPSVYELRVCLEKSSGGLNKGLNKLKP